MEQHMRWKQRSHAECTDGSCFRRELTRTPTELVEDGENISNDIFYDCGVPTSTSSRGKWKEKVMGGESAARIIVEKH